MTDGKSFDNVAGSLKGSGKKFFVGIGIILLLLFIIINAFCCKRICAGHVGIKVNMAGGQRGVEDFPTITGWIFYLPFLTQVVEYPTFMQTATWTGDATSGLKGIDVSISFNT